MTDNPANNPAEVAGPTCPHCGVAIGEHEATRCLDEWVCAAVFGHQMETVDGWNVYHAVADTRFVGNSVRWEPLPRYSSDISAAWEVVEEMRRKAPSDTWFCVWNAWETNRWVAGYMEYDMDGDITWTDESADALAAPLAICRAAVLAATGENT